MDANDNAGCLNARGAEVSIASKLKFFSSQHVVLRLNDHPEQKSR